jgi:glycosyltransferase involved in cell wall biosynthesis
MNPVIAHLTSVHRRDDTRIYIKQCCSLAAQGVDVSLVVADGRGDEQKQGVRILDVGQVRGRLRRIFISTRRVYERAIALNASLYQLHDPELLPIGLRLKAAGKRVIFDSHEDVPRQLLSKPYLNPTVATVMSASFAVYERYACSRLDGIITATPSIYEKFVRINATAENINNYPIIGELDAGIPWAARANGVAYIGDISAARGIRELVAAFQHVKSPARLTLGGRFSEHDVAAEVKNDSGWNRIDEAGFLGRAQVREILGRAIAGIVTFHPLPNHVTAQPNKLFEYMSAGIPIIASNFPLWRELVEGEGIGLCVDPLDPKQIAKAIDYLVINKDVAEQMGARAKKLITTKYNWRIEEIKLLKFYERILRSSA